MATLQKFNQFTLDLANNVHSFSSHTFKVMLTNTAPTAANSVKADITEIAAGNGYTAGGNTCTYTSLTQSGGVAKLIMQDPAAWVASGGTIGPFRYFVLYNDSVASPVKPLIGYWDYGSAITLNDTERVLLDMDQVNGVLTIT